MQTARDAAMTLGVTFPTHTEWSQPLPRNNFAPERSLAGNQNPRGRAFAEEGSLREP
jgi:hypothetical protein